METLELTFSGGISTPPQLGTMILKPTAQGVMSYAQNVSVATDVYGNGVVVPGYYFSPFAGASGLSHPIYWKAPSSDFNGLKLWVGYNGTNTFDYIDQVQAGGIPFYNNTNTVTGAVSGHATVQTSDMVSSVAGGSTMEIDAYVSLNDTTTTPGAWIFSWRSAGTTHGPIGLTTTSVMGAISNPLPMVKTQFDGNIYIGNGHTIDVVKVNLPFYLGTGVILDGVGLSPNGAIPPDYWITAMGEWNGLLVAAACTDPVGDFSKRNGGGSARIFFWDISNNPTGSYKTNFVNSPSHYISVLFTDLSGNLLAFGGVDEGRSTIYQYNGYGFLPLFSYIGDLPRNRHSVCFDTQGRLMWQTANGQICRLNTSQLLATSDEEQSTAFEHLSSIANDNTGGVLGNLQTAGYEFVASGSSFLDYSQISLFTGGNGGGPSVRDPVAISGIQVFPQKSIIRDVTVSLNKPLQSGESMNINMYATETPNYYSGTLLGTLNYANDGAVASKHIRTLQTMVDEAAFGAVWTTTNGTSTVPGLLKMSVDYQPITTL